MFFSNNKDFSLTKTDIYRIAAIIKSFSEAINLRVATALYQLTVHSADAYASVAQISNQSDVLPEKVQNCLEGDLSQFIIEKHDLESEFRFEGMYMNILPLISLLNA